MFAVILGGLGTRLRPLTAERPKYLLPVAEKPIIDWQIDQLKEAGISDLVVTCNNAHQDAVQEYLGDGSRFGIRIYSLNTGYQGSAPDLAQAISLMPESEEDFVLIYSDILSDAKLADLIAKHKSREPKPIVSFLCREVQYSLGVLTITDDGRVTRFDEKPRFDINEAINEAIYVISKSITPYLKAQEDLSTQVFRDLAGPSGRIVAYKDEGNWHHIENLQTYLETYQNPPEWLIARSSGKRKIIHLIPASRY